MLATLTPPKPNIAPPKNVQPIDRLNSLDGIRGIAAIAVMILHLTQHTSQPLFHSAGLAVDLFFCLSGFLIAHSYHNKIKRGMSLRQFALGRIIRLYPMFTIGLILGGIALALKIYKNECTLTFSQGAEAILLNAFYIPFIEDFKITIVNSEIKSAIFPTNDPAWSLFFELIINIVFALWATKDRNGLIPAALGGLSLIIYLILFKQPLPGWGAENALGGLPRATYGFFSGVYIWQIKETIALKSQKIKTNTISIALIGLFLIPSFRHESYLWLSLTIFAVPTLVLAGANAISNSEIEKKFYDYIGWISYPIYCLHFPIYSIFTSITHNADFGQRGALFCSLLTWAIAHATGKYIDDPLRTFIKSKF